MSSQGVRNPWRVAWAWPAIAAVLAAGTQAGELTGTVLDSQGRPLAGAVVSIVNARHRAANSLDDPRCSPDCGKHTVSAANGQFALRGIDANSIAEVLVDAAGYLPVNIQVDLRAARALSLRLHSRQDPRRSVRGKLLLPDGSPASHVLVMFSAPSLPNDQFAPTGKTQQVVTDHDGTFSYEFDYVIIGVTAIVQARGCLSPAFFELKDGGGEQTLQLQAGATLTGQVLRQGQPASGIVVKVASTTFKSIFSAAALTDDEGRFTITAAPLEIELVVYSTQSSLDDENLAVIPRDVRVPADQTTWEVGELNLYPALQLRGRVKLADGKPSAGVYVTLECLRTREVQHCPVDRDGSFAFRNLPGGEVVLSFSNPGPKNSASYRLSPQNLSAVHERLKVLWGRVDQDLDLTVLLEPGESLPYSPITRFPSHDDGPKLTNLAIERLRLLPLRGVPTTEDPPREARP